MEATRVSQTPVKLEAFDIGMSLAAYHPEAGETHQVEAGGQGLAPCQGGA